MNTLTYVYDNKIYLNLTNKCSNNCEFCIRHTGDGVLDYYLWLDKEPTADEVIEDLKKYDLSKYKEAVFCADFSWGYFSDKDGRHDCWRLCEACYDKLTSSFKIPVETYEKTVLMDE